MSLACRTPPPCLPHALPRPRVTQALGAALHSRLLLLHAATGYGKTVAARQVWMAWPGARAWLNATDDPAAQEQLLHAAAEAWQLQPAAALPDLLQALPGAGGGLLLIDNGERWSDPRLWQTLAHLIDASPAHCHVVLLCRQLPPLPLMQWRAQGRMAMLNQSLLALTAEEWEQAGFAGGAAACSAAGGWWAAAQAASWGAGLATWIRDAWFASLTPEQHLLVGALSLLPTPSRNDLALLSALPLARVDAAWNLLSSLGGAVITTHGGPSVSPFYRQQVMHAWYELAPATHAATVARAVDWLLLQQRPAEAARLAHEAGQLQQQLQVLQAVGWQLLYLEQRALLQPLLLAALPSADAGVALLQAAVQIEVDKAPHRAEAGLLQRLPTLEGLLRGQALSLLAAIAWDYDQFERARTQAAAALACFADDRHPAYVLATLTLARVQAASGELAGARSLLQQAQACASRDGLTLLQLECRQRQAWIALEYGDTTAARALVTGLSSRHGAGTRSSALDSAQRLLSWLHLRRLDLAGAEAALADHEPRWDFAQHLHQALFALLRGDTAVAAAESAWLDQRLADGFQCLKWQNEAAWVRSWLAAMRLEQRALLLLEQQLAACDWPASLHRDRRRILLAAVRLLSGQPDAQAELHTLLQRLKLQQAELLARQLRLILALRDGDTLQLYQCVCLSAADDDMLDYVWLANVCLAPLQDLLAAPQLAHDQPALAFLRRLLLRLLPPSDSAQPAAEPPPLPAGLTAKEWQILQLIGAQYSNEQIAAGLFISLATVKTHINHIYRKLGISRRSEAMHRARLLAG